MIQTWGIGLPATKIKAKAIYNKIGRIPCPFFNGEHVSFTSRRFRHVTRDKKKKLRPRTQQLIRLRLLEYAESIVKNTDGKITVEFRDDYEIERTVNRYGEMVLEKRIAKSWGFTTNIDGSEVKLVIGQIEDGKKEFVSMMVDDFELHPLDETTKSPAV